MRFVQNRILRIRSSPGLLFYLLLLGFSFLLLFSINLYVSSSQQFVYLADSFLHHHLYFMKMPEYWGDTNYFKGHYYWPLGPVPAILLLPFVAIYYSPDFPYQGIVSFLLNILNLYLLYRITKKITASSTVAGWLGWGYIFSSAYVFVALIPHSWYFAQVVCTSLTFLAINEYFFYKRWWLVGIYVGLAIATRDSFIFSTVFFILLIVMNEKSTYSQRIRSLSQLLIPIICSVILICLYNYFRFSNPFDNGYQHQLISGIGLTDRNLGLWSIIHFPANLYYFFIKTPEAVFKPGTKILTAPYLISSYYGTSIFYTSPMFLWIIKAPWKNTVVKIASITVILMLLFMLGLFARGGYVQYGYRFALDFYPFLFLILIYSTKEKVSLLMKSIMIFSFLTNLYFICYMFFKIIPLTNPLLNS